MFVFSFALTIFMVNENMVFIYVVYALNHHALLKYFPSELALFVHLYKIGLLTAT